MPITNSTATGIAGTIGSFIAAHNYIAIIVLMALESASLPIPSEVVLPLTGHYVQTGNLNLYLAILATMIGTTIGITIDYYVALVLERTWCTRT